MHCRLLPSFLDGLLFVLVVIFLLQKVCTFVDPTPTTFLDNCMRLFELGVISDLDFLRQHYGPNVPLALVRLMRFHPSSCFNGEGPTGILCCAVSNNELK